MISIVVPVLNERNVISDCLKSLKSQDYPGTYEIIVVDNGSSDGSGQIALDAGAKVILCERRGVVFAREAGAEAASGTIIVQADADTVYPSNWLNRIARYFSTHPQSVALAGTYIYLDPPFWANIDYFLRSFVNILSLMFIFKPGYISGANFAFRREAFLKAHGYSADALSPDQWGIAHRLSKFGKIGYDRSLYVKTSARRIGKPLYRIIFDIIRNISHIISHYFRYLFGRPKNGSRRGFKPIRAGLLCLAIIIAVVSYGYFAPTAQVFGKVYDAEKTSDKVVALTFDDGPNEPYTSEILDILDKYNVKATFFVIGENVEQYPDVIHRIVDEGNVLGNHTYSHSANHALSDDINDIGQAEQVISAIAGVSPHLYRPPHGKKSPWELLSLKHDDLVEVTWTTSANDQHRVIYFGTPTPESYAQGIIHKTAPGRIILLHDGFGTIHDNARADKSLTVQALPMIIEELQKEGYQFVTVPQLLGLPAYN